MKILQLIDSLQAGGAERMCVNISNILKYAGHDIVICASREKGPLEKFVAPGISIVALQKRNKLDIQAFLMLLSLVKKNKIELIHAHSSSVIWAVAVKLFYPKIKVLWHDHLGARLDDDFENRCYRLISPMIDGIITVNEVLHDWAIHNMRVDADKITFIHNFPLLANRPRHSEPGYTTIVCLANLCRQKDHPTLVRAIHILQKKNPGLKLRVLFAGLYWNDSYYNSLVHLIDALDLKETIQIVGSIEDTATLLASADIGVLSSVSEGMPVSLLEYGLAGLPVIVTNVGECKTVLNNGTLGIVVEPSNPASLSEALAKYIFKPQLSKQIGKEFKDFIQMNYGPKGYIQSYHKLLYKVFSND
jgi:glycosyltransferase involved in cell wall biosynthesis